MEPSYIDSDKSRSAGETNPRPQRTIKEKTVFSRTKDRSRNRKKKTDEPVTEPGIDNWFYKNFGLGRLFNDDDDDSLADE